MSHKKKVLLSITALTAILLLCGAYFMLTPLADTEHPTYIYIDHDDTSDSLCAKLRPHTGSLRMAAFRTAAAVMIGDSVRPGCYDAGSGISTLRLVRALSRGRQTPVRITVPPVRTVGDLSHRLSALLCADSAAIATVLTDSLACRQYGETPETVLCLFLPDTYEVMWTVTPHELLKRMKRESDRFWTAERQAEAKAQGLTPREVIILASIVDQETAAEAEKPAVAAMYLNRLHIGMKLQADPTVKYAVGDFSLRRILHKHLTHPSPYNTYLNEGLPPGPICIPSRSGINAVLSPAQHNYIYMCAREDFSGTHRFAATYEEHLANARRYAEALDQRGIK